MFRPVAAGTEGTNGRGFAALTTAAADFDAVAFLKRTSKSSSPLDESSNCGQCYKTFVTSAKQVHPVTEIILSAPAK